jgi:hypothetical protein
MDFIARLAAAGPGDGVVCGEVGEEPERHLRASRVVGAQEQHRRLAGVSFAFDLGQCVEALAREAFGQQRQEVDDCCATGELVVRGVQESFDGFDAEGAVELALQTGSGSFERELLVDGEYVNGVREGTVAHEVFRCSQGGRG